MEEEGVFKCEGSGGHQMVDWDPDPNADYPGASVCVGCSHGVLLVKGSVRRGVSEAGHEGLAGQLRAHWVDWAYDLGRQVSPVLMAYSKQELLKVKQHG